MYGCECSFVCGGEVVGGWALVCVGGGGRGGGQYG